VSVGHSKPVIYVNLKVVQGVEIRYAVIVNSDSLKAKP
jgi:hypothetical protein